MATVNVFIVFEAKNLAAINIQPERWPDDIPSSRLCSNPLLIHIFINTFGFLFDFWDFNGGGFKSRSSWLWSRAVLWQDTNVSGVFSPWRWNQRWALRFWYPATTLYDVTTQKILTLTSKMEAAWNTETMLSYHNTIRRRVWLLFWICNWI